MKNVINESRLERVTAMPLNRGPHKSIKTGMCVMEATAYVAGEPWTDAPQCACPVIATFMRSWNDSLPTDEDRSRLLKPLIPIVIGTRSTPVVEQRRATMAADWLIRVHTPAWLRLATLDVQAAALEQLPEITDFAQCPALMPTLNAVRIDAGAARAAAWDAARVAGAAGAAWDAAWAAWDAGAARAAGAAAWAAWDAAWAAAGAAARDAARDAAWDAARAAGAAGAARDALQPTVLALQDSAAQLVRRMAALAAGRGERGMGE